MRVTGRGSGNDESSLGRGVAGQCSVCNLKQRDRVCRLDAPLPRPTECVSCPPGEQDEGPAPDPFPEDAYALVQMPEEAQAAALHAEFLSLHDGPVVRFRPIALPSARPSAPAPLNLGQDTAEESAVAPPAATAPVQKAVEMPAESAEVLLWLRGIGMPQYYDALCREGFTSLEQLASLTAADVKACFSVFGSLRSRGLSALTVLCLHALFTASGPLFSLRSHSSLFCPLYSLTSFLCRGAT